MNRFNKICDNIEEALEISRSTLVILSDSMENEQYGWVVNGIIQQLIKVENNMKAIENLVKNDFK